MVKKRIIIVLGLIILLPLIIYTAYEFTALTENEEIVEEVFQQQMDLILHSVNKNTWDAASDWSNKIDQMIQGWGGISNDKIASFLSGYVFIKTVFISDVDGSNPDYYSNSAVDDATKAKIEGTLSRNRESINNMMGKFSAAEYRKITAMSVSTDSIQSELLLVHITNDKDNRFRLVGVLLDIDSFIENIIKPSFLDLAREEFIIALFRNGNPEPVYSTEEVDNYKAELNKGVWLLPDYYIGIALENDRFENMASNRFKRSLFLISILTIVLLATGFYLFRNINREIELAKMKTSFVSNVSHELRTPLALIRMFAETIEMGRTSGDDEIKEYCNIISNESERLTLLINRILDFSKIEAGEKHYRLVKNDLNKIVSDIEKFYKYHLENKGFELISNISGKELNVKVDSDAVAESLVNLLDNAMKYSKDEKVVTISTGTNGNHAYVEVTDKGIGIPDSVHAKLFEKFFRVENSLTATTSGSGLGLSLVKHIMDAHDGKIIVKSKINEGSTFRLEFPLEEV